MFNQGEIAVSFVHYTFMRIQKINNVMFLSLTESSPTSPYFSPLEFDPRELFLYNISGWINPPWGFLIILWTYSQKVNFKTCFVHSWNISTSVGKKNTEIAFMCMKFCKKNCQDTYFFFFIQNCMEIRVFKYSLMAKHHSHACTSEFSSSE